MSVALTSHQTNIYNKFLKPILFTLGLILFLFLFARSWDETKGLLPTINWLLVLVSLLFGLFDNVLFSILFKKILTKYNFHIDYQKVGVMFFYGQVTKYIPGRFWGVLYHSSFVSRPGKISAMLFANLDLTAIVIARNVTIALALMFVIKYQLLAGITCAFGVVCCWLLCKNCWISNFFSFLFSRIKLFHININPCKACKNNTHIICILSISCVTYLLANIFLMKAVFDFSFNITVLYIAFFSLAWVLGALTFVVPAGIGIREIAFVLIASNIGVGGGENEVLAAIAVILRFWHILLEFCGLLFGLILSLIRSN